MSFTVLHKNARLKWQAIFISYKAQIGEIKKL